MATLGGQDQDTGLASFEELYRTTYGGMLALAIATLRDRSSAEDLVQDAYAQLWRRQGSVDNPVAWLRRAVVSNCLATLRTQRRRRAILQRQASPEVPNAVADDNFLDLLVGLNERQRMAVTLRYVHDLSEAEIADLLGCRPGTVKSTLHRAIRVLRTRLGSEPS